jgi:mRNA interferase RelE/StbE
MFKLKITSQAKSQLRQISKKHHKLAISNALDEIKEDPFSGKPLSRELTGKFSFKVGIYRIIYIINEQDRIVNILFAGHRAIVYD